MWMLHVTLLYHGLIGRMISSKPGIEKLKLRNKLNYLRALSL
jgi:hypothetical protein